MTGCSGRRAPEGGISPARSLTMTFSHSAACADVGQVEAVEGQAAGLQPLVVAGGAVGIDERLRRRRGCCPRRLKPVLRPALDPLWSGADRRRREQRNPATSTSPHLNLSDASWWLRSLPCSKAGFVSAPLGHDRQHRQLHAHEAVARQREHAIARAATHDERTALSDCRRAAPIRRMRGNGVAEATDTTE